MSCARAVSRAPTALCGAWPLPDDSAHPLTFGRSEPSLGSAQPEPRVECREELVLRSISLESLVTAQRPLEEINQAMDDLEASRGIRTVLSL